MYPQIGPTTDDEATRAASEQASELRDLGLFIELSRQLNRTVDLAGIMRLAENAVAQLMPSDDAYLALYDPDRNAFRLAFLIEHGRRRVPEDRWSNAEGLTGEIVRVGMPIITEEYLAECVARGITPVVLKGTGPARAWMGVPLRGDRVIGVLVMYSHDPAFRFLPRHVRLINDLADHTAAAIERARLYARAEEMTRQLAAVNEIGRAMTSTLDPEQVPALIMERIHQFMAVEEGSLLLRDEHTDELTFAFTFSPTAQHLLGMRVPPSVGIANQVVRTGQSILANDAANHPAFYGHIDDRTGSTTRDLLCVPLRGRQGVQGVIEVMNRLDGEPFTLDDQRLLELIADQAAVALENARLYARTDRTLARRVSELDARNEQLREILHLSNALMATSTLDDLLPQVAQAVRTSSGFGRVTIGLVHRAPGRRPVLRRVAAAGVEPSLLERMRAVEVNPTALEKLLLPQFQRGYSTYFIDHADDGYHRLWADAPSDVDVPAGTPAEHWHPQDTLLTILRSSSSELMGVIAVDQPESGRLPGPEQIQTLEIFAGQASVALENAYLYEQQRSALQSLTALNALGMAINSSLNTPEQILHFSLGGITDATGALGAVALIQQDESLMPAARVGQILPPGEEVLAEAHSVLETGKPRLVQAPDQHLPLSVASVGAQALILYPLRGPRSVIGVVYAAYPEVLPGERERDFLSLFAGQAGEALESLRLSLAVRQGRDRLAAILASTDEGIVMFDEQSCVAEANVSLTSLCSLPAPVPHGISAEEFLASCQDSCGGDPVLWTGLASELAQVRDGSADERRGRLMIAGTRPRAFAWTVLPVSGSSGDQRATILVLRDITKEVEAERLRQDLTSMIVHDLRGPLSSVLTGMEMLERGMAGELNDLQLNVANIAAKSSRKLLGMIDTLLDINKLEEGQMPLELGEHAVATVVETVVQQYAALLESRQITIVHDLPADLPLIRADGSHVERILQNLLDNAIKYTRRGGTVSIGSAAVRELAAGALPAAMADADGWVRLSISDQGPGIAPEEQKRIFEKFVQVGAARVKGTGLGLTFCRLSVEAHGGHIWIESIPGQGSTFHFTMPASPAPASPAPASPAPASPAT